MSRFSVLAAPTGTGSIGLYVKLEKWYRPKDLGDDASLICLTLDNLSAEEFDNDIDELIAELSALKRLLSADLQ